MPKKPAYSPIDQSLKLALMVIKYISEIPREWTKEEIEIFELAEKVKKLRK